MNGIDTSPEAFEKYLERTRATSTKAKYVFAAKQLLHFATANDIHSFETLPRNTLEAYVEMLVDQGYAAASIHVYQSGAKKYLRWVENQGVPVAQLNAPEAPRITHATRDALPPDTMSAFFRIANELLEPTRTAVMLLPCTGLRAAEMVQLPLSAIRPVSLETSEGPRNTIALVVTGKGGKTRVVPLIEEGVTILTEYLTGHRRKQPGSWVFPGNLTRKNRRGQNPMSLRSLRDGVIYVREALKMTFTPHTMRRTYLTSLYRRGVEPATLAKIAGHANIQTLFKHYLALDMHDVTSAIHKHGARLYD